MKTITKTVHYRKAEIRDKEGKIIDKTLEDLFLEALKSEDVKDPVKIEYGVEGHDSYLLLFTRVGKKIYIRSGCLCGCISLYDNESKVPLIDSEYDPETQELFNEEVDPLDSKNNPRKLEQQTHYFAIEGNHVAIVSSSAQGIRMLRDFLIILLQDKAHVIETCDLDLVNIPKKDATRQIEQAPVRKISLNSQAYTCRVEKEEEAQGNRKKSRQIFEQSDIVQAIVKVLKAEPIVNAFDPSDDLSGLSVSVEFSYKKRKEETGQTLLNNLARHIGGIDELNSKITLKGNSTISGDQLTIKDSIDVLGNGKNLNKTNVYTEIGKWLAGQIKSGLV